jgi:hypothetical protein
MSITGKCYRIYSYDNGICLTTQREYCIDHTSPIINILGIWENKDDCLKLYQSDIEHNRIDGTKGLNLSANCWDVLSEIHAIQNNQSERHWYFRKATHSA